MVYSRIVVGTDGSETATVALLAASVLANRLEAELTAVVAYDEETAPIETAWKTLDRVLAEAREAGATVSGKVKADDPASAIMEVAETIGGDLIVTGNKGMGKPRRFVLGSVPDKIAHGAPCDLLIVRTATQPITDAEYRSILIATDGSPTADEAARHGFALARALGSKVTLVHVGDPALGKIVCKDTAERLADGIPVEIRPVKGDPAGQIVRVGEDEGNDLIVVGSKGMMGPQRFLRNAVPNEVAHKAGTDVLVVKTVGRPLSDLKPGEGAVVLVGGDRVAAYRADDGTVHAVSPKCTHMGCTVGWNDEDRTWDCPCHGSRYAFDGQVIHGPAQEALKPLHIPGE